MFTACHKCCCLFSIDLQGRPAHLGVLLLRIVSGGTMVFAHGFGKLTGFSEQAAQFPDPLGFGPVVSMGLAIGAEFFCALALVIGLATRLACIPLMITMGVAFFVIHAADPFQRKELAFIYLACYAVLFLTGAGRYSLDSLVARCSNKKG